MEKEWLASKQQWIAIDSQGNEVIESFITWGIWDRPEFKYGMIPQDRTIPIVPKCMVLLVLESLRNNTIFHLIKRTLKRYMICDHLQNRAQ
jgi:hypothetical protein